PPEFPLERESLIQAIGHLYERRSVVAGHEVLAEALNQNLGYIDLARLHAQAEKTSLVALTENDWTRAHFATPRGLALERWAVDFIGRSRGRCPALGRGTVAGNSRLSPPQREAVNEVLASRDQVVCLRGAAGVGKTTMIKELHGLLSVEGRTVFYCAPTSSAADTLRQDGLATATTVADFLQNVSLRECGRLSGSVLVVDEAGLASNVQGGELLRLAERYDTRVVFLGDSKQHTSVEAGDFLRILETHSPLHRVEVTDIRRQKVAEYRGAVKLMAVGTARAGLERLDKLGWVQEGRADYLRAAVDEYLARSDNGTRLDTVIAVMPTWRELDAFTAMLRDELKTRGVLGAGERLAVHDPLPWTRAQQARPDNYAPGLVVTFNRKAPGWAVGETAEVSRIEGGEVWLRTATGGERRLPLGGEADFSVARQREIEVSPGDRLLVRANDRAQGLINGETLTVAALRGDVIETAEGRRIDTARFRRFSHGFAVTSHKSQSKTADHVVVAAERLNGKAAYVACSRGRYTCSVHTPDKEGLLAELPEGNRLAALDFLGSTFAQASPKNKERERAWQTARDWLRQTAARVGRSVQTLGRVWSRDGLHAPSLGLGLSGPVDAARSKDVPGDGC
ncbi:MAG TPA: AAA family ATPase, partial [Rariglobus sp.]